LELEAWRARAAGRLRLRESGQGHAYRIRPARRTRAAGRSEVSVPLKNDRVGGQAMKALVLAATAALAVATAIEPADAWMRAGGGFGGGWGHTAGGGVYHTGDAGGFEHGTAVGPNGVAHEGDAGGYWHGSAANGYGAAHASTYGGYYHGTYANANGAW